MVALPITILIVSFIVYLLLREAHQLLADGYLFVLFIFSFIISNKEFSMFYLILFLVAILLDLAVSKIDTFKVNNSINFFGSKASGFSRIGLSLVIGISIYIFIIMIGNSVGGNIVGAPDLTISTTQDLAQAFKPTLESSLGIIENRVAFVLFGVLNAFGLLIPLIGVAFNLIPIALPAIVIGLTMGIFHVAAYGISAGLIIWAALAFMIFIATTFILQDSLAADIAHYVNNARISLSRSLAIVV